jgi:hypothetical protein
MPMVAGIAERKRLIIKVLSLEPPAREANDYRAGVRFKGFSDVYS